MASLKQDLMLLEKRTGLERARGEVAERWREGERGVRAGREVQQAAAAAEVRFGEALARVYRNPEAAKQAFTARAERDGWSVAMREMRQKPQSYGRLHGYQLGWFATSARREAQRRVPEAIGRGGDYLASRAAAARSARPLRAAGRQVEQGKRQFEQIRSQLEQLPSAREVEQRIGKAVDLMSTEQREALLKQLTPEQVRTLEKIRRVEQERSRGRHWDRGLER